MSRPQKIVWNYLGKQGCVDFRRSQITKTQVGLYHASQAGISSDKQEDQKKPWVVICEEHGEVEFHSTMEQASSAMLMAGKCKECWKAKPSPLLEGTEFEEPKQEEEITGGVEQVTVS